MNYKLIILKTIELEGGYCNDENDAGGETNFGICKRNYPDLDIKNLTREQAVEIYKTDYYDKIQADKIENVKFRWKLFDMSVNIGQFQATKIIQKVLGITIDGVIGKETLDAMNSADYDAAIIDVVKEQMKYYIKIVINKPSQLCFLKGWCERAFTV
jgi:lysozyme family protein